MRFESRLLALGASAALVAADSPSKFHAASYNNPTAGPPTAWFSGANTVPVTQIASAAAAATQVPDHATYIMQNDGSAKATIKSDWAKLDKGSAYVWVADMDVDCDGLDSGCKGNPDGQDQTNFGAVSAYEVPFFVIPDKFATEHADELKGNNVGAVICNGQLFYGVFADTDGDTPEEIGEASWLMARTCFPDENLDGGNGHTKGDVTYIVFTGDDAVLPGSAINKHYIINFDTLKTMGDGFMSDLANSLKIPLGGAPPARRALRG